MAKRARDPFYKLEQQNVIEDFEGAPAVTVTKEVKATNLSLGP